MMFRKKDPDEKKFILIGLIALIGMVLAALADKVLGSAQEVPAATSAPLLEGQVRASPAGLQSAIEELARREPGRNGVLVRSLEEDWVAGFRGATIFPQGTLRRLWLGAALLDAVDQGELSLEQPVPLSATGPDGTPRSAEIGELLRRAVKDDDRKAQDQVLEGLSGPDSVARWLDEKDWAEVAFGPSNQKISRGMARVQGSNAYLTAPPDGATPDGIAYGLAQLFTGKLLSEDSTHLLLDYFGVQPASGEQWTPIGWHVRVMSGEAKEGDGKELAASAAALVRSRQGRQFAVSVFTTGGKGVTERRDRILRNTVAALEVSETR